MISAIPGNGLRCVSFTGGVGILHRVATCYVQLQGWCIVQIIFFDRLSPRGNGGVSVGAFM